MFKELFLSVVISASVNIESSNDTSKAHDYEYMFKLEKNEDNISYLIERDWERELGNKFIDNIFRFNYVTPRKIYYGIDVIDKESKEIDYKTLNIGYKYDFGMQCGISIKEENEITYLANLSYNKKIRSNLSSLCNIELNQISLKATTTDKLGFLGRGEGIATFITTLLIHDENKN